MKTQNKITKNAKKKAPHPNSRAALKVKSHGFKGQILKSEGFRRSLRKVLFKIIEEDVSEWHLTVFLDQF